MTLAHIAGVPFEEWLTPLAMSGTGLALALRAAVRRTRHSRSS
jgi:hypothetical protein